MLPFDVMMVRNKFFYATIEALIRQGVGSEEEMKMMEGELENIINQV
jgi:hypothetical protein